MKWFLPNFIIQLRCAEKGRRKNETDKVK